MNHSPKEYILGLMGGVTIMHHAPAAVLIADGEVLACCEDERYTRSKHGFGQIPVQAIAAALDTAGISIRDIAAVFVSTAAHPEFFDRTRLYLEHYFGYAPQIEGFDHQTCHLASAFYPSTFEQAMVVTYDGYGDHKSMVCAVGSGKKIEILGSKGVRDSLGIFYQILTQFIGFSSAGDEYKVMGLSAYGKPGVDLSSIIKVSDEDFAIDASFWDREPPIRSHYEPRYTSKLVKLLGEPRRRGEPITDLHKNIAFAVQKSFEDAILGVITRLHKQTGLRKLCLAGGCALNCRANMRIMDLPFIDELFVQPASTDQGTALGAALLGAAQRGHELKAIPHYYLGSSYSDEKIRWSLKTSQSTYEKIENTAERAAASLAQGKIVAIYHGRSEFGPRALGKRSILANAGIPDIKDQINSRIKFREEFRPFAPAVLAEEASSVFEMDGASPYMTVAFRVRTEWRTRIPGVTHCDGTARVQTVHAAQNRLFHDIISHFYKLTGIPLVVNTSFNVMGEPIVESPLDAIRTFKSCGIDELYLGDYFLKK